MKDDTESEETQDDARRQSVTGPKHKRSGSRGLKNVAIAIGALVVVGAGYVVYEVAFSDTGTTETTLAGGAVVIPQLPSLLMVLEEGTLYVENDGNVTMSDVEVRNVSGVAVCSLGVISPGDRKACPEAEGAQDLTVFGSGPQGQEVEASLN